MNKNKTTPLKLKLATLPESPGCYLFYDEQDRVIYVGKAKNLKRRVSSYFHKEQTLFKTKKLVSAVRDLKYTVVEHEQDALLLENNLIKQYRPKYNVLLKDDKGYPSIVITKEPFPRVFQTRNVEKNGSLYFGPYASAYVAKLMIQFVRELYPIRTCRLNLSAEAIARKNYHVCLQYHLKQCLGPCVGRESEAQYNEYIQAIKEIFKGNGAVVTETLLKQIHQFSEEMRFEEAATLKKQYDLIENFRQKSTVVAPSLHNIDVFSFEENEHSAYVHYMHVGNGAIVQVYTIEYKKRLAEEKEDLLALGVLELRSRFQSDAKEIIVPFKPHFPEDNGVFFTVPQKGDKKKLLDLSIKNVKQYKLDQLMQAEKINPEQRSTRIMKTVQHDLHLTKLPMLIECFDNSNIQGSNPVASCVVFRKAKPSKKEYRHFHIKSVVGPDDFASMHEVVSRRYSRLLKEEGPLPQLIVIDGGKGQLNAAFDALIELGLSDKIAIVGLAKRLEELFFPGDPVPLILNKNSESLKLLQFLRDEAHRFGLTFHRSLRSKHQVFSSLDAISGIGAKTKEVLLKKYKSVKRLNEASSEELEELIGKKRTSLLLEGLKGVSPHK